MAIASISTPWAVQSGYIDLPHDGGVPEVSVEAFLYEDNICYIANGGSGQAYCRGNDLPWLKPLPSKCYDSLNLVGIFAPTCLGCTLFGLILSCPIRRGYIFHFLLKLHRYNVEEYV